MLRLPDGAWKQMPEFSDAASANPFFTFDEMARTMAVFADALNDSGFNRLMEHIPVYFQDNQMVTVILDADNIFSGLKEWVYAVGLPSPVTFFMPEKNAGFLKGIHHLYQQYSGQNTPVVFTKDTLSQNGWLLTNGLRKQETVKQNYFQQNPKTILRYRHRSVAVLDGNETSRQLQSLAAAVMHFFGLAPFSISKVLVPVHYDFVPLLDAFESFRSYAFHHHYASHYEYYKSLFLLNGDVFFDNGVVLLKSASEIISPPGVLYFDYKSSENLRQHRPKNNQEVLALLNPYSTGNSFSETIEMLVL